MKEYKHMFVSSYSNENFYIEKFEMGADAFRENFEDGSVERLRVVSIVSTHKSESIEEALDIYDCDYDYDVIFINGNTKYAVAFESDETIDELPEIIDITWC